MRKYFSGVALGAILLFQSFVAKAEEIRLSPSSTSVTVGSTFTLDVLAADINLGAFTLFIDYPAALASLAGPVVFDENLGGGMGLSFAAGQDLFGQVSLDELSFADTTVLEGLQGAAPGNLFRLATLTFQADAVGTAVFDFSTALLSSFSGDVVTADLVGASVQITGAGPGPGPGPTPVPEPSTWVLMGVQFGVAVWMLKRRVS